MIVSRQETRMIAILLLAISMVLIAFLEGTQCTPLTSGQQELAGKLFILDVFTVIPPNLAISLFES